MHWQLSQKEADWERKCHELEQKCLEVEQKQLETNKLAEKLRMLLGYFCPDDWEKSERLKKEDFDQLDVAYLANFDLKAYMRAVDDQWQSLLRNLVSNNLPSAKS